MPILLQPDFLEKEAPTNHGAHVVGAVKREAILRKDFPRYEEIGHCPPVRYTIAYGGSE